MVEFCCLTFFDCILSRSMVSSVVHPSRALIVIIMTSAPRAAASDLSTPVNRPQDKLQLHKLNANQLGLKRLIEHHENTL